MDNPESVAAEAQRLVDHPLLTKALDGIVDRLVVELLSDPPSHIPLPDHDKWRRDRIDSVNAVRGVKDAIRTELMVAGAAMARRGGIA